MKPIDLMFGCLGNGVTVCDRGAVSKSLIWPSAVGEADLKTQRVFNLARIENGDYKTVAHIDPCGAYKLYCSLPPQTVEQIARQARGEGERFAAHWESLSPVRRHRELAEYVLRWAQYRETGGAAVILHMSADESLDLYRKYTCINGGYTLP